MSPSEVNTGKRYWRSLDDLADTPEFREFMSREFPAGATDILGSADRRQFLKLMGASMALAGFGFATGCRRWPSEKIAPFAHRPAGRDPGVPVHYATSMELGGVAAGLLVTSYDGRPIKIEGNPDHPINRGATDAITQASILDLYDPDRSRSVLLKGKPSDWSTFTAWAKSHFTPASGKSVAILSEATSSPSVLAMKEVVKNKLGATWYEYEPLNNDNEIKGSVLAFGTALRPQYFFDKAKTVVSLDSDFLNCAAGGSSWGAGVKWTRDFATSRRAVDTTRDMSRLYVFESGVSLTGANADHRVALRCADVALIAARLAAAILPPGTEGLQQLALAPIASTLDAAALDEVLQHVIDDLKRRSPSIIIVGTRQPAEVHMLAHLMNDALGNLGQSVAHVPIPGGADGGTVKHAESIKALAADIAAGKVQTLVMLGGNPAYDAPADLQFADLLKRVPNTVHLSFYEDETSALCTWHVNRAHYLEAWADGRAYDGTITLGQPLIEPLFDGKSSIEVLAAITSDEFAHGYDIVRRTLREQSLLAPLLSGSTAAQAVQGGAESGAFEAAWRTALHAGFVAGSEFKPQTAQRITGLNLQQALQGLQQSWTPAKSGELEVVFAPDSALYDGRFANNGWLQELPDPIAKLTWDNAIFISPAAARERNLTTGDMVTVSAHGQTVTAAVMVLPGHYRGSATLTLGYGREFNGRIAKDSGFNFYKLRSSQSMGFASGATLAKAAGKYVLATTQDHQAIDTIGWKGEQERLPTLFREATLAEYRDHPDFAKHRTHVVHRLSLWDENMPFHHEGQGANYAWAMSIDLNACTGCNACVIACQSENNIPIVGKEQVKIGREMHWIRIDRYFTGHSDENPHTVVQAPVPCMHCENAPCEQVCPVAATTHDADGLNVMVYNRCVGTRYCSNNCPYKVRRFNYFDFHRRTPTREQPGMLLQVEPEYFLEGQATPDPLKQMQFNPEVTVRMRGVMEKCTYCVQRITGARIAAKNEWVKQKNLDPAKPLDVRVPIPDGMVTPACAQACPAQAIVFGDLRDKTSRVARLHRHDRTYEMLEELNTKPRTRYMARLRNPAFGEQHASDQAAPHG